MIEDKGKRCSTDQRKKLDTGKNIQQRCKMNEVFISLHFISFN